MFNSLLEIGTWPRALRLVALKRGTNTPI